VFATFVAALVISAAMVVPVLDVLEAMYPDVPAATLFNTLPGLLVTSLATSICLLTTLVLFVRPLEVTRLRLLPGWETGSTLLVIVLGLLALGQLLESSVALLGLDARGALPMLRQALHGAAGADLFAAVLVFGLAAGAAEEIFFRGYMQWRLREHWSARSAVLATSAAFGAAHLDTPGVYAVLGLAMGLYLGFVAEVTGSTLPAIVCHVVNNVVYTLQTALGVGVVGRDAHVVAVVLTAVVLGTCIWWVRRAAGAARPA
jgi:membrane protease YdiL (CAAX protease family)